MIPYIHHTNHALIFNILLIFSHYTTYTTDTKLVPILMLDMNVSKPFQGLLISCNQMSADYLFQTDKSYDVCYDTGDKVIQCGRHNDIFKFWLMWRSKVSISLCYIKMVYTNVSHAIYVQFYHCYLMKSSTLSDFVFAHLGNGRFRETNAPLNGLDSLPSQKDERTKGEVLPAC